MALPIKGIWDRVRTLRKYRGFPCEFTNAIRSVRESSVLFRLVTSKLFFLLCVKSVELKVESVQFLFCVCVLNKAHHVIATFKTVFCLGVF